MSTPAPKLINALLRCQRSDEAAHPLFERVNPERNLWVWELGPAPSTSFESWLETTEKQLQNHIALLQKLRTNSEDYTLHLSIDFPPLCPLRFTASFLKLADLAGFNLEVVNLGKLN